jgi:single stranded DNA-binding protein
MEARIAREAELKFTKNGNALCTTAVGFTPRHLNRATDKWEDGETSWFDLKAWGATGEMLAEIPKGTLIQIFGHVEKEYWKGNEGDRREKTVITVDRLCIPVISNKSFSVDDDQNLIFRRYQGKRTKDPVEYTADEQEPF